MTKQYRKTKIEIMWQKATGNYTNTTVTDTPTKWKKNGELMRAVSDNTYFAIIVGWILGPFALGFISAIDFGQPPIVTIMGVTIAALWFSIEFFVLVYTNRHIPSIGDFS